MAHQDPAEEVVAALDVPGSQPGAAHVLQRGVPLVLGADPEDVSENSSGRENHGGGVRITQVGDGSGEFKTHGK